MSRRVALLILTAVGLLAVAMLVPLPSIAAMRTWSESVGPAFALLFFAAHTVVTVAPIPRTLFTVAAGVLFGTALGLTIALTATTLSALLAFLLVRRVGHAWVLRHLTHPAARAVDAHLERRGWLAVGSLRLIAPVPFAVVNYCSALSSVHVVPYLVATAVGIVPGTVGVVVLSDSLVSGGHPAMIVLSIVCVAIGVLGLIIDARWKVDNLDSPESSLRA